MMSGRFTLDSVCVNTVLEYMGHQWGGVIIELVFCLSCTHLMVVTVNISMEQQGNS